MTDDEKIREVGAALDGRFCSDTVWEFEFLSELSFEEFQEWVVQHPPSTGFKPCGKPGVRKLDGEYYCAEHRREHSR